jgi:hypothetical protein
MLACLFAEHFGDDEDQKSTAKTTSKKQVNQRIANSTEHGDHCCDHNLVGFRFVFVKKKGELTVIDRTFTFQYSFEF